MSEKDLSRRRPSSRSLRDGYEGEDERASSSRNASRPVDRRRSEELREEAKPRRATQPLGSEPESIAEEAVSSNADAVDEVAAYRKPDVRSMRAKRMLDTWRGYAMMGFAAVMIIGGLIGLLFFARPSVSEAENRTLTAFPEFTPTRFVDGSYFTDFSLWYADTYPTREPMVSAYLSLKKLFGVQSDTQMVGGNRQGDELPVDGEAEREKPTHAHNVTAPENRVGTGNLEDQITNGIYKANGACYTLYWFDEEATREYAGVINDAAELLGDEATVYSVLIPTNAGVMLEDETLADLGVPNQGQAIEYFYSLMTDDVVTVPTFDILREHRDEYLYFRTDHHWTQVGSYYAYVSFCKTKGIEPAPVLEWQKMVFEPFWGEYTSYVDMTGVEADSVEAFVPTGTNTMTYWVDDLNLDAPAEGPVVADFSDMADDDAGKYNCFVCGNQPLSYIENPNVTDGSSCLVIKDSFGNPFVTDLVDSYQYIYTIDFRFTDQKMLDLVREHNIQDVIFENVIMFAGTYDCVDYLSSIVYPDEGASAAASADAASDDNADAANTDANKEDGQ